MIQHLVLATFKEEAAGRSKAENMRLAKEKALALQEVIPQIRQFAVYFGAENAPLENADFAIVSSFDSMETLDEYQVHPDHAAFGEFVVPLWASWVCMDYEI